MRSAPAITFEYRPSRRLFAVTAMLAVIAPLAVVLSGLPASARLVLVVAFLAYAAATLRTMLRPSIHTVAWRSDGGWTIGLSADAEHEAELHDYHIVAGLIVLRLRWPRHTGALVLLPDNLDSDTRRRLRMRLSASADTH